MIFPIAKPTPVRVLTKQLLDAGIPITGVDGIGDEAVIRYSPEEATLEHRAIGDAMLAAFDWEAAQAAIDAQILAAEAARQAVIDGANQILADSEAGIAACQVDLATIASGLTAVTTMSTIAQQRQILTGMLNVMNRIVTRQGLHINATAIITRHLRNEAAK